MSFALRASAASGWLPASILALATSFVLSAYGTPISQVAIFAVYVIFGIALPGMLWVRLLRGRATHLSEDLTLGLAAGYCVEIATYIAARAVGAPLLFVLWPILTLAAFIALPSLRRHWRGGGERAPMWWSWSLAAMVGYLLIYSAGTFFAQHHLTGTDTPYVDMPFHLALIGELKHHVPPQIPWVTGVPLAYHWFFYAEAAATSWVTGIEPVTLLYRLSGLPMFVAFIVLTATAARRLTGGWWSGPLAVAIALFGAVAAPYRWIPDSVWDTQTLIATWTSPTNLLGLALFAATLVVFIDLLHADSDTPRSHWLLVGLLIFGVTGAKASVMPLLIVGLMTVILGVAITRRRLHRGAVVGLGLGVVGLVLATIFLYHGTSGGLTIGLGALQSFPVALSVGAGHASGIARVGVALVTLLVALLLWSFLWAGAYGLLVRWRGADVDAPILLLLGICAAALGAVSILVYPSVSQLYYLRGAAGAFGLTMAVGIAALLPEGPRRGPLIAATCLAALVGAGVVATLRALGPADAPRLGADRLTAVLLPILLPVLALVAISVAAYLVARVVERRVPALHGAVPVLVVALVMGLSVPRVAAILASPFTAAAAGAEIPGDGIAAARWLRDHSDPADLAATNLHCRPLPATATVCDARHFWVAAYAERRFLVEGWSYTTKALASAMSLGISSYVVPFWSPPLLAANDAAFTDPSAATLATLRDVYGVHWLIADLATADSEGLGREADLRYREGDFAVYELRQAATSGVLDPGATTEGRAPMIP